MTRTKRVIVWDMLIGWLVWLLAMVFFLVKIFSGFYQVLFMVKGC